jgi:sugar O-acyltransferase (sialic acid O-acetyltransferase NeuD family)
MGQEVAELVLSLPTGTWELTGFVDDAPGLAGTEILALPVLGGLEWLAGRAVAVALAIGAPAARWRAGITVQSGHGHETPVLVHAEATVGQSCSLGDGTIVAGAAVLTADVIVGRFAIVNVGATVSHNCRLADFVTVAPGAHLAGNVTVGEGADIGIGASIIQGRHVGEWSVIGAGAVVINDVEPNTTVVGCPARVINKRPEGWYR